VKKNISIKANEEKNLRQGKVNIL